MFNWNSIAYTYIENSIGEFYNLKAICRIKFYKRNPYSKITQSENRIHPILVVANISIYNLNPKSYEAQI